MGICGISRDMERNASNLMDKDLLSKMQCRHCGGAYIAVSLNDSPLSDTFNFTRLNCSECGHVLEVRDGILNTFPSGDLSREAWNHLYDKAPKMEKSLFVSALQRGFENNKLLASYYPLARMAREFSAPIQSSLELGAGSGTYSLILKKLGFVKEVTLLDYSYSALKAARSLFSYFGENCNLVLARLEEAPFIPGAFDLALSGGVIEHYSSASERLSCFKAHLRHAKLAYIQAPANAPCYWLQRALITIIKKGWPFGYEKPVTIREIEEYANISDTRIVIAEYQYFMNMIVFWAPWLTRAQYIASKGWGLEPLRTDIAVLIGCNN